MKKRNAIVTSANLQMKSDVAISAFKGLIAGLKIVNEKAEAARAENEARIEALQTENKAIADLFEKNAKIVQNVENLLGV